jgi:hypothetical protein
MTLAKESSLTLVRAVADHYSHFLAGGSSERFVRN